MSKPDMRVLLLTACPRALIRTAALIMVCAPSASQAIEPDNKDLLGTWTLTKVPDKVTVAGQSCRKRPKFTRHYEDAARYIRETAHAPVGRLGIPTVVEAVELACIAALIKGDKRIAIYWQGFFFEAVKEE